MSFRWRGRQPRNKFGETTSLKDYTDDQRSQSLAVLQANGGKLRETARQLGIPHKTLQRWIESDKLITQKEIETARAVAAGKDQEIRARMEGAPALPGKTWTQLRSEKTGELASAFEDIAWMCVTRLSQSELLSQSVSWDEGEIVRASC